MVHIEVGYLVLMDMRIVGPRWQQSYIWADGRWYEDMEKHKTEWVTYLQPMAKFQLDFQILPISTLVISSFVLTSYTYFTRVISVLW